MDNSTKSSWQLLTLNQSLVDSIDGMTLKQQDFHQELKKQTKVKSFANWVACVFLSKYPQSALPMVQL